MKVKETSVNHRDKVIYIALGVYVATVLWLTLINREPAYRFRVLLPFFSYRKILEGDINSLKENLENIAFFIPTGYFLRIFFQKNWKKIVFIGFCISLGIELIQLVTTRGCFEPDDLLHNSLGTFLGWYLWKWAPVKVAFCFNKLKKLSILAVACTLLVVIGAGKISDYISYHRMISYAALSDTAEHKNLLVLNGNNGYCWDTDVCVVYQEDGSLKISGTSDRRSWYPIGDIRLDVGTYEFSGLSGVDKETVAIELEYYDKDEHKYIRLVPDVGPVDQVSFTLDEPTKIRAYVGVYDGCDCDVTAKPKIFKEE